jgi:hypothetical protein
VTESEETAVRPRCIFNDYYKAEQIKKGGRVRLGSREEAIRGGSYDGIAY